MDILVREMTMEDYDQVYKLWTKISGFRIRSIDDSREGVERFLKRNPTTSVVAVQNGHIVGNILCGHDGRTGCFYHVCVEDGYRHHGMVQNGTCSHQGHAERGSEQDLPGGL